MTFTIPNIFIAGRKAIASEVNENFSAIKKELNRQGEELLENTNLLKEGSDLLASLSVEAKNFCINSGNVDSNGDSDLLKIDEFNSHKIIFKVGNGKSGNFCPITYRNYKRESAMQENLNTLDMTNKSDGTYMVFVTMEGETYALKSKIHINKIRPQLATDDIWIDTSVMPIYATKFDGYEDKEFNDVALGEVVITSGNIATLKTFNYNQNAYEVNMLLGESRGEISGLSLPSSKYIDLVLPATGGNFTAQANGYFYLSKSTNAANQYLYFNAGSSSAASAVRSSTIRSAGSGDNLTLLFACRKGEVVYVTYTAGGATNNFRFIYAEGAK